jgi:hypothetical protein
MRNPFPDNIRNSPEITDEEIIEIICSEFPHWKLACDPAAPNPIVIEQRDFGRSRQNIFLLHVVIRYASIMGKTVVINP